MNWEQEILEIQKRNRRVEADKAWETSWARRIAIALFTYAVAAIWLALIREPNILLKAVVPVAGYVLSTLSLRTIRNVWVKFYENQSGEKK